MDAAAIHAKIYAGRGKAALRLGLDFEVYRPLVAASPLTNKIGTLKAAFNAGDNRYLKPNMPGDAYWHGDYDGRLTIPGDYLIGEHSRFFVASQQQFLPILVVECNCDVSILRPIVSASVGDIGYGGVQTSTLSAIAGSTTKWPASILISGGREKGLSNPASAKEGGFRCLLPSSIPSRIKAGDIIQDGNNIRYLVQSAEGTESGWRLIMTEKHT